jgi:hypothetical protein
VPDADGRLASGARPQSALMGIAGAALGTRERTGRLGWAALYTGHSTGPPDFLPSGFRCVTE